MLFEQLLVVCRWWWGSHWIDFILIYPMTTFSSPGDEYRPSKFQCNNRNILFFHTIKIIFFETLKMVDSKKVVFIDHTESNYFSKHFPKNQHNCWLFTYFDAKLSKTVKKHHHEIFQFSDISIFVIAVIYIFFDAVDFHYFFKFFCQIFIKNHHNWSNLVVQELTPP